MRKNLKCKFCNNKNIIKKGFKRNKLRTIQKYQCKDCRKFFTLERTVNTTYSIKTIIKAISLYNLGYNLSQVSNRISNGNKIPISTIDAWLNKYQNLITFKKIRSKAIKLYKPNNIIKTKILKHQQIYNFKIHNAKLELLKNLNPKIPEQTFQKLKNYLNKGIPYYLPKVERSSQFKFKIPYIKTFKKNNNANLLANLTLKISDKNSQRHQLIQDFMLINDTSTIATEIPVYLTKEDLEYYSKHNFNISFKEQITGHIDILQIRNNMLHILDYKPEAIKTNPYNQLVIYALALSSRLRIPLKYFKTAWFDENNYYEFYPLTAVYKNAI